MIEVSNQFLEDVENDNRAYQLQVTITLTDNTVLNLTNEDLWSGGVSIDDSISQDSSLDLGATIINQCTIVLNNINQDYSGYDFSGATVNVAVALDLTTGTTETFQRGVYTVNEQNYDSSLVTLTCLDNMNKFEKAYSNSSLTYPATLAQIVADACTVCGVTAGSSLSDFTNYDLSVASRPSSTYTFRAIIGYIAQIAGMCARCAADGKLEFTWYDKDALDSLAVVRASEDNIDRATEDDLIRWIESGSSSSSSGTLAVFPSLYSINTAMDDTVVTGIRAVVLSGNEALEYSAGVDGYILSLENNIFITSTNAQAIVNDLADQIIGLRYRKANFTHLSVPFLEPGDVALIYDGHGNQYGVLVSSTTFTISERQNTVSAGATPARNRSDQYSQAVRNYLELPKPIYTWIAYASDASGTNISTSPMTGLKYIGVAEGQESPTVDTSDPSVFTWSQYVGDSIESVETEYYLSSSNTTQTGGTWSTTPAEYVDGYYYWKRDKTTWDDGTIEYSTAVLDNALNSANETAQQAIEDAADAALVATNYITDTSNGVFVHPEGTPSDPTSATAKGVLIQSQVDIIRGGDAVASYGDSVTIGKDSESHVGIDYHSLQFIDKEGTTYFYVSDLRDSAGEATIIENYVGDGETVYFYLSLVPSSITSVTVDGITTSDYTFSASDKYIRFTTEPGDGEIIEVTYVTESQYAKAYTAGIRDDSGFVGAMSFAEGYQNVASGSFSHSEGGSNESSASYSHSEGWSSTASGYASHAENNSTASGYNSHSEGVSTVASGYASHAEGYQSVASWEYSHAQNYQTVAGGYGATAIGTGTIANGTAQLALGEYNIADNYSQYAIIVGDGASDGQRSNLMTLGWDGTLTVGNTVITGGGSSSTYIDYTISSLALNYQTNGGAWRASSPITQSTMGFSGTIISVLIVGWGTMASPVQPYLNSSGELNFLSASQQTLGNIKVRIQYDPS